MQETSASQGDSPNHGAFQDPGASYTVSSTPTSKTGARKFRRSRSDRMVAGVCGGLAKLFTIDAALIRIGLVAATILGLGSGLIIYLICWIIAPED